MRRFERAFGGKRVAVVGGTRGLGFALVRRLARVGADVTICGRDAATLERAQARFAQQGLTVDGAPCDATDRDAVRAWVSRFEREAGAFEALFYVAGIIQVGALADQREEDYRQSLDTHFFGALHFIDAVLPSMRVRRNGRIVTVASIGGLIGVPHLAPYCAGKSALVGYCQAAGAELASEGVKLTCVCPGLIRTGSPDRATFKGDHRSEYAWFTLSDAAPFLSQSAERVVDELLHAAVRGKARAVFSAPAQIGALLNGVAPNVVSGALALAARLMPRPGGPERHAGVDSHGTLAPSILTTLDQRAAAKNNQHGSKLPAT